MGTGTLALAGWLLSLAGASPDTTLTLRRGDRVVMEGFSGSIQVRAWDRAVLSLSGAMDEAQDLAVSRTGDRLVVSPGARRGRRLPREIELRLPSWAPLEIQGRTLDVDLSGTAADVTVTSVEGDIVVADVAGTVTLSTVDGTIDVRGARGPVSARSRDGDVTLVGVEGDVDAYSGSGDLTLDDVTGTSVKAETLDGDLTFAGALAAGGSYSFSTHDGDAVLVLPARTSVRARVSTFDGEFLSDFPVTLQGIGRGAFEFTLGDGAALLEIKVFDGEIRLRSGTAVKE